MLFHVNSGYANAPQCYVIRTTLVLFNAKSDTKSNQWALHGYRQFSLISQYN